MWIINRILITTIKGSLYTVSRLRPPQPRRHRHQQHHRGEARRPHRYPPYREGEESQAAHDRSSLLFFSLDPPWLLPVARVKEDWEETLAPAAPRKPLFARVFIQFFAPPFSWLKGLDVITRKTPVHALIDSNEGVERHENLLARYRALNSFTVKA